MQRTTIMLPPVLKTRAAQRARKMGLSMGQFIRHSMEQALEGEARPAEGTIFEPDVYAGPCPSDVSANVDEYLYGKKR